MTAEQECFTKLFNGCTCAPGQCQSYAAKTERRRPSPKSKRDAEAIVRAKLAAERAVLTVLAILSIAAFLGATTHTLIKAENTYQLEARI